MITASEHSAAAAEKDLPLTEVISGGAHSGTGLTPSVLALIAGMVAILAACGAENERWVGLYYENLGAMGGVPITRARLQRAPRFSTLQACTEWGNGLIAKTQGAGYQCAFGCRPIESTVVLVDATVCKDSTAIIASH